MSDYKRFVSYIYGYEQGEKKNSTGFAKINARGGECKIWIHMKGFYTHGQKPYKAYIYTNNKGRLRGIFLGEMENRNGALEWNGTTETERLMGSAHGIEECKGIYIEGGDRIFAAEWDDYPVDVERFEPYARSARQSMEEAAPEADTEDEEFTGKIDTEKEKTEEEGAPEGGPEEPKREGFSGESGLRAAELTLEAELEPEQESPVFFGPDEGLEESFAEKLKERPEEGPADRKREQWAYLVRHFPVVRYVEGPDSVIFCIRLGPKDLARLPRNKWELGNNSFLLHGYYQYRHLLLCRKQTPAEISYLIGVPGVYNEKEQMMAAMFGFEEFKIMKGPEPKTGSFGYWCRIIA